MKKLRYQINIGYGITVFVTKIKIINFIGKNLLHLYNDNKVISIIDLNYNIIKYDYTYKDDHKILKIYNVIER